MEFNINFPLPLRFNVKEALYSDVQLPNSKCPRKFYFRPINSGSHVPGAGSGPHGTILSMV